MTNFMQGFIKHVQDYFKEFQSDKVELIRPFLNIRDKSIIGFFFPFAVFDQKQEVVMIHRSHTYHMFKQLKNP